MSLSQQNRFTALASSTLDAGHSEPHRLEALRAVVRRAGTVLENAADKDSRLACGPGCAACCSINVTILEPEALAIRDYVDIRFSTDERRRLVEDL